MNLVVFIGFTALTLLFVWVATSWGILRMKHIPVALVLFWLLGVLLTFEESSSVDTYSAQVNDLINEVARLKEDLRKQSKQLTESNVALENSKEELLHLKRMQMLREQDVPAKDNNDKKNVEDNNNNKNDNKNDDKNDNNSNNNIDFKLLKLNHEKEIKKLSDEMKLERQKLQAVLNAEFNKKEKQLVEERDAISKQLEDTKKHLEKVEERRKMLEKCAFTPGGCG